MFKNDCKDGSSTGANLEQVAANIFFNEVYFKDKFGTAAFDNLQFLRNILI